jgi:hypothetical protein
VLKRSSTHLKIDDEKQELVDLMEQLHDALIEGNDDDITENQESLEDFLYYVENNAEADS